MSNTCHLVCPECNAFLERPPSALEVAEQGLEVCRPIPRSECRCKNCDVDAAAKLFYISFAPYAVMREVLITFDETGLLRRDLMLSLYENAERNSTSIAEELEITRVMIENHVQAVYTQAIWGFRGTWGMEDEETRKRVQDWRGTHTLVRRGVE
jgi:hypothetical protein